MANAAVQPEVSPGFWTSITRSLFFARHDLDVDLFARWFLDESLKLYAFRSTRPIPFRRFCG